MKTTSFVLAILKSGTVYSIFFPKMERGGAGKRDVAPRIRVERRA
jgi:hypothetical protein